MSTLEERSAERRRRIVGNRAKSFAEAEEWDLEFGHPRLAQHLDALVAFRATARVQTGPRQVDSKER